MNKSIHKIGFCGVAGSGKTTIAKQLNTKHNYTLLSFASRVKEFAQAILLRPIDKYNLKDREFLQFLGTDLARKRDRNIWLTHFNNTYQLHLATGKVKFVVDDIRFCNEADFLRKKGFYIIKLVGRCNNEMGSCSSHVSETELENIVPDFILDNSGSVKETVQLLKTFLEQEGGNQN